MVDPFVSVDIEGKRGPKRGPKSAESSGQRTHSRTPDIKII